MSHLISLVCVKCNASYPKDSRSYRCFRCSGLLDPLYEYEEIKKSFKWEKMKLRPRSIWRWHELLPVEKADCIISLGEGDTPLVNCKGLAQKLGLENLYIKNDGLNPTGSLKDRSISVAVSKALEFGFRVIASDSSGNKAASMAAYAARAGLGCLVFCPVNTPTQKLLQIVAYGGKLVLVDTTRNRLMDLYSELIQIKGKEWYDLGLSNPFRYEGKKTYAYEIVEALGGVIPEWIFHPAGGSMSVIKNWKGFKELKEMELIHTMPKMVGVQSEMCAPIVQAYENGSDIVSPVESKPTIAGGLSIANPGAAGDLTLKAIRESGGKAISISEEEVLWGMQELWKEGIFSEPTGAVTISALKRMILAGSVQKEDTVVCVVTGSGFKDLHTVENRISVPKPIPPKVSAIRNFAEDLVGYI